MTRIFQNFIENVDLSAGRSGFTLASVLVLMLVFAASIVVSLVVLFSDNPKLATLAVLAIPIARILYVGIKGQNYK